MVQDFWRQLDFYAPEAHSKSILIVGAGATGSYAAYLFNRLGVKGKNITVVDFDVVEQHNLPNQFFALSIFKGLAEDAKISKVIALQKTLELMNNDTINIHQENVIDLLENNVINLKDFDYIVYAVDSMSVRKYITAYIETNAIHTIVLDPRTGGEFGRMLVYSGDSESKAVYKASLHTDEEAAPLPCTGQAVVDVSAAMASAVITAYRHCIKGSLRAWEWSFDWSALQSSIMNIRRSGWSNDDEPNNGRVGSDANTTNID